MNFQAPRTGYVASFKVAGVPTFIHWSFPVAGTLVAAFLGDFALLTTVSSIAAYVVLVLAHELGHAYFAIRADMKVHAIVISAGGGFCFTDHPPALVDRLLLYSGGLLVQLVIFVIAAVFGTLSTGMLSPVASCFYFVFTFVNAAMFLGSVIPYADNDGSMVLRALKESRAET